MLSDRISESNRSDAKRRLGHLARCAVATYAWLLLAASNCGPSPSAPLCAASQHICNGDTILVCNEGQNGYNRVKDCQSGTRCVSGQQQCIPNGTDASTPADSAVGGAGPGGGGSAGDGGTGGGSTGDGETGGGSTGDGGTGGGGELKPCVLDQSSIDHCDLQ